jgi:hypothetical protein
MQPHTLKQEAIEAISRLPDDINDVDEIMYRLYVLDKLRKSREAVARGEVIAHEELQREVAQW